SLLGTPQPGLIRYFIHSLFIPSRRRSQLGLVSGMGVVLVRSVLVLPVIALRLVLGRGLFRLLLRRGDAPQVTHPRLDLIHQANVFVITNHARLGGVIRLGDALGDRKSTRLNS